MNTRPPHKLKSVAGFSLIEMLVTVGIISGVALLTANFMMQISATNQKISVQAQLNLIRDQYLSLVQDDTAWAQTVTNATYNPSMACLRGPPIPPASCAGQANFFLPLLQNGGAWIGYQPVGDPAAGFRPDGSLCNTFNAATPDPQCPIRVDFFWRPLCTGGCTRSEVQVEVEMTFQVVMPPGTTTEVLDPRRFNSKIRRKSAFVAPVLATCTGQQVISGFDSAGQPLCVPGNLRR